MILKSRCKKSRTGRTAIYRQDSSRERYGMVFIDMKGNTLRSGYSSLVRGMRN